MYTLSFRMATYFEWIHVTMYIINGGGGKDSSGGSGIADEDVMAIVI